MGYAGTYKQKAYRSGSNHEATQQTKQHTNQHTGDNIRAGLAGWWDGLRGYIQAESVPVWLKPRGNTPSNTADSNTPITTYAPA